MKKNNNVDLSYYPGCSLATTAKENNASLKSLFHGLGYNLIELQDWNCCGSSSAHSIDTDLAFDLASRNLSLAPPGRPLLVACPSCLLRLRHAFQNLQNNENTRIHYEKTWGRPFDPDLEIMHYFELLDKPDLIKKFKEQSSRLTGLKFVTYYGCMLARPPGMNDERNYHGLVEKLISSFGATPVNWPYSSRCCGTFLTVARPEIVTPVVNQIIQGAKDARADCIITACAMCHMNLEVRCTLRKQVPIMHFSEVLSMALNVDRSEYKWWMYRHLVNPQPVLNRIDLS